MSIPGAALAFLHVCPWPAEIQAGHRGPEAFGNYLDTGGTHAFLVIGLLGAFTTFSTFGLETVQLVSAGNLSAALLSVGLNLSLGLGAVWVGAQLAI